MLDLSGQTFDAIVVEGNVDPGKHGGVRVKVYGLTDGIEDNKYQPVALPVVNSMTAVPTVGSIVKVYFEEGDIHQPKYTHVSTSTRPLPSDYYDDYPNISVSNMGGDEFYNVHNRSTNNTTFFHPSNSTLTWDSFGKVTHESDNGFNNSGRGAKNGQGEKIQPVLTGGTIDIFSATPFGKAQGSDYFEVTHKARRDTGRNINTLPESLDVNSLDSETGGTAILDGETIDFSPSNNYVETSVRENDLINTLLISNSGGSSFTDTVDNITSGSNDTSSAHYVINTDGMIVQCIDPQFASFMGNRLENDSGESLNINSVSVIVIGNGFEFTPIQFDRVNQVISHMKSINGNDLVEVLKFSNGNVSEYEDDRLRV
jgi:hypothetical protein